MHSKHEVDRQRRRRRVGNKGGMPGARRRELVVGQEACGGGGDDEEHEEEERPISGAEERGHADETPRCARQLGRRSFRLGWWSFLRPKARPLSRTC